MLQGIHEVELFFRLPWVTCVATQTHERLYVTNTPKQAASTGKAHVVIPHFSKVLFYSVALLSSKFGKLVLYFTRQESQLFLAKIASALGFKSDTEVQPQTLSGLCLNAEKTPCVTSSCQHQLGPSDSCASYSLRLLGVGLLTNPTLSFFSQSCL